jgi:hypothetical protein
MTNLELITTSVEQQRRRDHETVCAFADAIRNKGIAHTIGWDATDAIVAEKRLGVAVKFLELVESSEDEAFEYLAFAKDDAERQIGWFDPTNQSTSASSSYVSAATYKAQRAVVDFVDSLFQVRDDA